MAQVHYTIDNDKLTVNAVVELLNDKEMKLVKKYVALGFKLVPVAKAKPQRKSAEEREAEKAAKAAEQAKKPFAEVNIRKYLKEKGTAEQRKHYEKLYNEQAKDKSGNPVFYKTDSKEGKFKKGEPKKRGHINTLSWFRSEFPDYPEE